MDGRYSELNESRREKNSAQASEEGVNLLHIRNRKVKRCGGRNRGSSKSAGECVVGGKGNPGNRTCPGDPHWSYLAPYCRDAIQNDGGLRLASVLSWLQLRHKTRRTAGAGNRSNLWEISPWTQGISEGALSQAGDG